MRPRHGANENYEAGWPKAHPPQVWLCPPPCLGGAGLELVCLLIWFQQGQIPNPSKPPRNSLMGEGGCAFVSVKPTQKVYQLKKKQLSALREIPPSPPPGCWPIGPSRHGSRSPGAGRMPKCHELWRPFEKSPQENVGKLGGPWLCLWETWFLVVVWFAWEIPLLSFAALRF